MSAPPTHADAASALDRRTVLKAAAASMALGMPASAQAPQAAPIRPAASDETTRRAQPMSGGGLSKARLGRMHDVMAGHVERGAAPGLVALVSRRDGFWDNRGWGFGVSVITRRDSIADVPGRFGWDGGYGTSWYVDPKEDLIGILMTQRLWDPAFLAIHHDFWISAYQAIDD